jgi:hypothetical protein
MHGYSRKSFTMLLRAMISLFMFQYHHLQNLPHSFTDFLIANSQFTNSNTEPETRSSKLHVHYHRTNYTKHSHSVKGVDVRNNLDVSLTKKNITTNLYSY